MVSAFGNAGSADHAFGDEAAAAIDSAALDVAALVGGRAEDVLFTSGATEAINMVLKGHRPEPGRRRRFRIAVSPTEHSAVLQTCAAMARGGAAEITVLRVDGRGHVDLNEVAAVCADGCDLVCVMAANNEIGTIASVDAIATLTHQFGVGYLCDASQAGGRIPLRTLVEQDALVVLSAHKMYGPQGVGALVSARMKSLRPLIHGGEQQHGRRAGTLNVPGVAGFGLAARLRDAEMDADEGRIARLRDALQARFLAEIPDLKVNGDPNARLAGNLNIAFPGIPNGAVIARVRVRLAIATGAACASGIEAPSHVLRAIGLADPYLDGALRIGLGKWSTAEDIELAGDLLIDAARSVTAMLR
jgi:cysteine desulfurase